MFFDLSWWNKLEVLVFLREPQVFCSGFDMSLYMLMSRERERDGESHVVQ